MSWFQERPAASLELIAGAGPQKTASLIDVGGGTARLVDCLIADSWSDITVLELSDVALDEARARVGPNPRVQWIGQDLLTWHPSRRYDIWHDRAVFHFLVREDERRQYREVMRDALAPNATIIVGTFANDGPRECSGLPVARYDAEALVSALGASFDVLATKREEHVTPHGNTQPFTWVALRHTYRSEEARVAVSAIDDLLTAARARLERVFSDDLPGEMASGAVVVDMRPITQRLRDGELPGAIVIDRNVLEWRLDPTCPHHIPEVSNTQARIILVCSEGYGSSLAAATLQDLGLRRATDLVGGFQSLVGRTNRDEG